VESQRSTGSSEKETESGQHFESTHSISPPLAISPDGHKRKRDTVEDSGASKLAETAAEESSPEEQSAFDPFADAGDDSSSVSLFFVFVYLFFFWYSHFLPCFYIDRSDGGGTHSSWASSYEQLQHPSYF
jgi:hypothetical protein